MPGNPFRLDGKTVLVTGASSGIGREVAVVCSRMGARLVISGRDEARLGETLRALVGEGHEMVAADLLTSDGLEAVAVKAGKLDGLVHSAGVRGLAPLKLVTAKFLDDVFAINYRAPVLLTQRLLHKNAMRNGGSIVFMASISAHLGTTGVGIYAGSKAALVGTMRCLALEQAKRGIRVNCLSPGLVETKLVTTDDPDWFESQRARYPLGVGQPEDVANATIFMLSNAARWITGTTLIMDGGVTF